MSRGRSSVRTRFWLWDDNLPVWISTLLDEDPAHTDFRVDPRHTMSLAWLHHRDNARFQSDVFSLNTKRRPSLKDDVILMEAVIVICLSGRNVRHDVQHD